MYFSSNSGQNWTPTNNGLPMGGAIPVAIDATDSARLYAGSRLKGVFLSTNSGSQWTPSTNGMTMFVRGIAIDPVLSSSMYAATLLGGIFHSNDGGQNWNSIGLRDEFLFKVALDPHNPQVVYAASSSGIQKSVDSGNTWMTVGQRSGYVFSLAEDPRNSGVLYLRAIWRGIVQERGPGTDVEDR